MPAAPLRPLTPEEIEAYDRDGVVCARRLFAPHWVERMAGAVDRVTTSPGFLGRAVSMPKQGFSGDLFLWLVDDDFRDFVFDSPSAHVASQILRSKRVNFFYDQLFVKPAGCHVPTPWHHDVTFWPIEAEQVCSIWMTFDPVTRESSGLEFVRGSHRWPNRFKAVTPNYDPYMLDSEFEDAPDIDGHRGDFDLVGWDMEPGDVLIFNGLVVHGSSANTSTDTPRRAFTLRWTGDDARFAPRHATMPILWPTGLKAGDPLGGPVFPQVLPRTIPGECERCIGPPVEPDPEYVAHVLGEIRDRMTA